MKKLIMKYILKNIFQKYFHFNIDILIFINDIYNINIYNNYLINNFF